jgi:FemAB-related protein (PEP-CTERM system-associated)
MLQISLSDLRLSNFLEQQAKNCFYYHPAWLDLIIKLYGYSLIPLTTTNTVGLLTGFLPLCYIESFLTGRRLVALPFSDYCPLLAADQASANDLIEQALCLAREKKVKYLELRSGKNDVLARRSDLVEGNLYVRWYMPLAADPEDIWKDSRRTVKQNVRRAQKLGVQIRAAQERGDIAHFYHLHLLTRTKKHGMPAQPQHFFFELWDAFAASGKMRLLLAEYHGIPIASMILLISGTTVTWAYSASNEQYQYLTPNNLLWWEAIVWSSTNGYHIFDFGRTARDNAGLMEFKRRQGAIMEALPYYYYPNCAGLAATSQHSWNYSLLTACWKRLPLQLAGQLGGHLYKHLG